MSVDGLGGMRPLQGADGLSEIETRGAPVESFRDWSTTGGELMRDGGAWLEGRVDDMATGTIRVPPDGRGDVLFQKTSAGQSDAQRPLSQDEVGGLLGAIQRELEGGNEFAELLRFVFDALRGGDAGEAPEASEQTLRQVAHDLAEQMQEPTEGASERPRIMKFRADTPLPGEGDRPDLPPDIVKVRADDPGEGPTLPPDIMKFRADTPLPGEGDRPDLPPDIVKVRADDPGEGPTLPPDIMKFRADTPIPGEGDRPDLPPDIVKVRADDPGEGPTLPPDVMKFRADTPLPGERPEIPPDVRKIRADDPSDA